MNKNMCVIGGTGTVGKATMATFNITKQYSRKSANITLEEAAACDFIFVCLPTPVNKDGSYDTSNIDNLIKELSGYTGFDHATVVIRSTVYPGYCTSLYYKYGVRNIVFNPEFLSEDTWEKDAVQPQLVVIGADTVDLREKVKGLYCGRFKYNEPIVTDSRTAELIKLSLNGFFTTKVIFANAIYDYAQRTGCNYEVVRKVLESHPWGSKGHFEIFHKGGRGAGGKCLKKDIQALAHYTNDSFVIEVTRSNEILLAQTSKE